MAALGGLRAFPQGKRGGEHLLFRRDVVGAARGEMAPSFPGTCLRRQMLGGKLSVRHLAGARDIGGRTGELGALEVSGVGTAGGGGGGAVNRGKACAVGGVGKGQVSEISVREEKSPPLLGEGRLP